MIAAVLQPVATVRLRASDSSSRGNRRKLVISLYVCVDVDVAVDVDLDVRLYVYRCISAQTDIILNTSIHYIHAYSRMGEKDARCAVPRGGLDGSRNRATGSIS